MTTVSLALSANGATWPTIHLDDAVTDRVESCARTEHPASALGPGQAPTALARPRPVPRRRWPRFPRRPATVPHPRDTISPPPLPRTPLPTASSPLRHRRVAHALADGPAGNRGDGTRASARVHRELFEARHLRVGGIELGLQPLPNLLLRVEYVERRTLDAGKGNLLANLGGSRRLDELHLRARIVARLAAQHHRLRLHALHLRGLEVA
mmetsp:Transcript_51449/g.133693  ORF Transcript_51449/g.133693 Transcript_51449/m.133693 type:complete len:210 (-) Transcript_51449:2213-2842(-)